MADRAVPQDNHEEDRPDASIDHAVALEYWNSIPATDNGMLAVLDTYPQIPRIDVQGSTAFLAKLRLHSTQHPKSQPLARVVDCGAGIGRITLSFLSKHADVVDIVEPVVSFTREITEGDKFKDLRDGGCIGKVYNVGLESWHPEEKYSLIWNQWCLGHLTDAQLVDYFKRCAESLTQGGWIVVKENMSTHVEGKDEFDPEDSSVTRTDTKFRKLFEEAGLKIVATELQRGWPKKLFPIRSYALQPKE
ncbi:hypothetical protein M501DRAFT_1002869 [Patellaria atrata CBS 101060]|uniref:Alpha N-terminal protein methyltransferase 1 n=1 Tax=Patellaria atrata CBS 101060 TaxID=1346257 RepID=A0A9P4SDA9_9PEZI|nr:hypothetical protein M501DRAFT_1002869 [Patellaria atrata CBS 101060]